jgi:spore coat polysaccharide biosynthesis predicted glycosyltransferase SpsG
MHEIDILFHRSEYLPENADLLPGKIYAGIEYSIIQKSCHKINAGTYESNLSNELFPIAISMGGGDAANKTKTLLEIVKKCNVSATFWVALGEGYQHSYDELIRIIKEDTYHEIILVRSNQSLWRIFGNCVLSILLSGITAYEAIFAGLPSIILYDDPNRKKLVKELFEKDLAIDGGLFDDQNLLSICQIIEGLYRDTQRLFQLHLKTKNTIPQNGSVIVVESTIKHLNQIS